jgi:hypothetical protein
MGRGGRGAAVVLYTPDNLASYGVAHIRCRPAPWWTAERVRERLAHKDYQENMAPGGAWWLQVELFKAERASDTGRVAEITALIEKQRKDADMRLRVLMARAGR